MVPSEISRAARVLRCPPVDGGFRRIIFLGLVAAAISEIIFPTDNPRGLFRGDFEPALSSDMRLEPADGAGLGCGTWSDCTLIADAVGEGTAGEEAEGFGDGMGLRPSKTVASLFLREENWGELGERNCWDCRMETSSLVRTVSFDLDGEDQGEDTALRKEAVGEEEEGDLVPRSSLMTCSIRALGLSLGFELTGDCWGDWE
jgi:hypothetical protein